MAYQSLYRRYRPQTFGEIRGQRHVVAALQNAVAKNEVGHAYLVHGPRGTGKTTTARVLAKALNCENLGTDGEPCGTCESCVAIEKGRSFDLHELDAASNNKVDDMRDLLAKVNLGTPGRTKVYLLDEVHMLTAGAENALLKTLEEPPDHVTWVLATTEPHKVVQTIRSRCQVFELGLLDADEMTEHVRWVVDDAGLAVDATAIDYVVSAGAGSVRDTLSALDRVVAAGGIVELDSSIDVLLSALADRDVAAALTAVGDATGRGRDPRSIGEAALAGLRDAFLTAMGSPPPRLAEHDRARADDLAGRLSPSAITRALDLLGSALVEMRQAPDPRVDLEVALVRLCRADTGESHDALVERIEHIEQQLAGDSSVPSPPPAPPEPAPPESAPPESAPPESAPPPPLPSAPVEEASTEPPRRKGGPAAEARRKLAQKLERSAAAVAPSSPVTTVPPPVPSSVAGIADMHPTSPSEVVALATEHLGLDSRAVVERANELLGPSQGPRSAEDLTRLWRDLVDHAGSETPRPTPEPEPVTVVDPEPSPEPATVVDPEPSPEPDPTSVVDIGELVDAPAHAEHLLERLTDAFPGAELQTSAEDDVS